MNAPIRKGHLPAHEACARQPVTAAPETTAGGLAAVAPESLRLPISVRVSLIGSFIILLVSGLYLARDILLPIALAFMLTLTLSPVVRYLARFRIPEVVIEAMRAPVDAAVNASKQVEEITSNSSDPTVQKVVVQQPGLFARAAGGAVSLGSTAGITIVLLFFLLASGRLFYEKLVRILPTMTEKKRAIRVVHAVEDEVSVYLLTITLINAGLGVVIAGVMWASGMPNAILWGVMAAALNFVPYVGALVGVAVVAVVALVSFDSPGIVLLVPALYFACTVIEGQFITPALLGRRLEMNTVAVFLSVAIWGWLWGVLGALMAVPLLVSLRVLCDHFEGLSGLGEFLAGPIPEDDGEPEESSHSQEASLRAQAQAQAQASKDVDSNLQSAP